MTVPYLDYYRTCLRLRFVSSVFHSIFLNLCNLFYFQNTLDEKEAAEFAPIFKRRHLLLLAELQAVTSESTRLVIGCAHTLANTNAPTFQTLQVRLSSPTAGTECPGLESTSNLWGGVQVFGRAAEREAASTSHTGCSLLPSLSLLLMLSRTLSCLLTAAGMAARPRW